LFDVVDILEDLQVTDVEAVAKDYFTADRLTVFKILPE
jgi:predicted Zn-dependent peptidase